MAAKMEAKQSIRKPKNRQTKVHLVFDEKARKEYLTGFRKRKAERRKKFNEKLKKDIKSEKKRLQTEFKDRVKKSDSSRRIAELEHLVENNVHVIELPKHTVTIEPILDSCVNYENTFIGQNENLKLAPEEHNIQTRADKKKEAKHFNRQLNKKLKKTSAFKRQTQIARDKSRKKARQLKRKNKSVK